MPSFSAVLKWWIQTACGLLSNGIVPQSPILEDVKVESCLEAAAEIVACKVDETSLS